MMNSRDIDSENGASSEGINAVASAMATATRVLALAQDPVADGERPLHKIWTGEALYAYTSDEHWRANDYYRLGLGLINEEPGWENPGRGGFNRGADNE